MAKVAFKTGKQAAYDALVFKDESTLYYITDTQRMYKGELLMSVGKEASDVAAGLLSPEDKALLDSLLSRLDKKVDKVIESEDGKALIFNEVDGGGAKFENEDGTASFVGVNKDTNGGIGAQLYDIDVAQNKGVKIDITKNGAFYTKGDESAKAASLRDIEANEILTKKDIQDIEIPEYSLKKDPNPGDYAAIYHLTKDGVNVGEAINIAKDQLLKSVEIKTCVEKDVPIEGLEVGDKYLDFTFIVEAGAEAHTYIAIKDMVKPYTAGNGIIITSNNVITFDPDVLSTVTYVDQSITNLETYFTQELNNEHAGRVAGDNLLQAAINAEEERAKAEEAKKTVATIIGTNGTARMFNEADGGGAKFENKNGVESFVGVNDGTNGIVAQIYADKYIDGKWQGTKLDVANGGMYYTVGNLSAAERMIPDNEIATKGDIEAVSLMWEPIA